MDSSLGFISKPQMKKNSRYNKLFCFLFVSTICMDIVGMYICFHFIIYIRTPIVFVVVTDVVCCYSVIPCVRVCLKSVCDQSIVSCK